MFNKKIELKIALVEKDMKEYELAEKLGLSPDYIRQVVGGIRELGNIKKKEVAEILDVPVEILFK